MNRNDAAHAEEDAPMSKSLVLLLVVLSYAATTASGAVRRDRDHDRLSDRWEKRYHLSTSKKSAKGDPDHDGLRNLREYRLRINPRRKDTDRDGLRDRAEVRRYHTNPRKNDSDSDGYSDGAEVRAGTNPRDRNSHPSGSSTPSPTGFPGTSNTGVPGGTALSAYTGPSTISTPGTVVNNKTMGCVRVTAPGVIIRKSKIACAGGYAVTSGDGDYAGTALLIEDSEIDCKNTGGTALGEANIIARRVNIHGCENGGDINQNFTVQDSYIHDLYTGGDAHTDGLQFAFGHYEGGKVVNGSLNVTITHNTIYGMGADGSFGTSAIISNRGGDTNVLIQGNLLAGGAVALYCEQGAKGSNYRVLDNRFSRAFGPKVGAYGPSTDCSDETQSGNVIHETGQPLKLP
jgi:thrombospondin type 3 repeat protein